MKLNERTNLSLSETEGCGQLGAFRQGEILRPLETSVELLQLQRRVDRARFAHLLAFAIDADARFE